ncbi:hypothetical protein [carnivorous sponge associated iridovirus]|nr:hypothetical protein [carnivorous sponge associated iridovirus]
MNSNSSSKSSNDLSCLNPSFQSAFGMPIGPKIEDNGSKWGSYVQRNFDGSFPFDEKMQKERPDDWMQMIRERVSIFDASNRPHHVPKIYGQGRTKPKN